VRFLIEQYEKKLGKLLITTLPGGAEVSIDGERQNDSSRIALDPGRHVITARAEGHLALTAVVEIAAAEEKRVTLTLRPIAAPSESSEALGRAAVPTRAMPRHFESSKQDRTLSYLLGGTAVVLGGAAVGIVLHNSVRFDDWKRTEEKLPPPGSLLTADQDEVRTEQNEARQSIETWDDLALGMGIAASATLGIAAVLWFTGPANSAARVSPFVGLGVAGVRGSL
jgi:hypothetical protein